MSQQPISTRSILPIPPRTVPARPSLRVVPAPARRVGRAPFIVLCSVLMSLGLLALLALNLSLASGSYALHDISVRAQALAAQQSELEEKLAVQQTPARLAARAGELGMVAGGTPAYLRLSDGAVIGEATPAPTPAREESASGATTQGTQGQAATGATATAMVAKPSATTSAQGSGAAAAVGEKPRAASSGAAAGPAMAPPARKSAPASSTDAAAAPRTAATR